MAISPNITWVEFTPQYGIATKHDCKILKRGCHIGNGEKKCYMHFPTKDAAIGFISQVKGLDKHYTCRLCSDEQFGSRDVNGEIIFTPEQIKETYNI